MSPIAPCSRPSSVYVIPLLVTNQIVHLYKAQRTKKIYWIKKLLSDFFVSGLFAIFPDAGVKK